MRGGRRSRGRVLAAGLAVGLLCLSACVVSVRDDRLVPLRLAKGSMRWTYSPLGDLIELLASPLVCLALPVLTVFDPGLAGWVGLCLLPGFVTDALAFESDLDPAPGFATRLEGPLAAVAAELGRRRGRSAAVSPSLAGTWVNGVDPGGEVEDLSEWGRVVEPVDGLTLLLPGQRGRRRREPLSGPGLVLGPDVWPDEGRVRVERRGRALLVRAGDEDWDAALEAHLLGGPDLPAEEDCRGPRVGLHAGEEPLDEVVERLAAVAGRRVRLEGEPGQGRVSFHLQDLPWEQALALVAWASGRELRAGPDGAAVLWAPADLPVTAAIRGAAPGPALALLARAAGLTLDADALPAGPLTRLHLEQVPASEALPLAAELLGASLATGPGGELCARRAGPAVVVAPRRRDRPRRRGRRWNRGAAAPGPAAAPSVYDSRELLQLVDERLRRAFLGEEPLSDGFEPDAAALPAAPRDRGAGAGASRASSPPRPAGRPRTSSSWCAPGAAPPGPRSRGAWATGRPPGTPSCAVRSCGSPRAPWARSSWPAWSRPRSARTPGRSWARRPRCWPSPPGSRRSIPWLRRSSASGCGG